MLTIGIITSLKIVSELTTSRAPCGCIRSCNMDHITGALWWTCTPIRDVCNNKICGQIGHKAHNFLPRC